LAEDTLKGLNVAILVTDGFEQVELTEPAPASLARAKPARTMADAMPIFRGGLRVSDEALAPLAEPPATARIGVLAAKLPETGSLMPD
jgi:hypothetical protein